MILIRFTLFVSCNMAKSKKININNSEITVIQQNETDFISLTDIARHKDSKHTDTIIQNWMRNTIELLGFWESIYNHDFSLHRIRGGGKLVDMEELLLIKTLH